MISFSNLYPGGQKLRLDEVVTPDFFRNLGVRLDANETAMFLRQLTDVYQQTYDIKYPDLKARQLIPVDNRVNAGAESFLWRQFDMRGKAKVVQNYADDFPNAEVLGKEFQTRIVSLGDSYQYTVQDLRAASMAGIPLETRKAETARRVMENLVESIACTGLPVTETGDALPIYGIANFPNINKLTTTTNWLSASTAVSAILADVNAMQKKIFDTTLGVFGQNVTLVLPTQPFSNLSTTSRSPTFTDDSVLQYILKQSPWIKSIEYWPYLDTAGKLQDGTTAGPRALLYERTPEVCQLVIPQEFEQLPPQQIGMSFKIPCHMRIGGVTVRYPLAICALDGMSG